MSLRTIAPLLCSGLLTLACGAVASAAAPSGLQITSMTPGSGCPKDTSITVIPYGRIAIGLMGFSVTPNRGRIECTVQIQTSIPAGYQFTFADYKQNNSPAVPLQSAQAIMSGRLDGITSKALVDVTWTIPKSPAATMNRAYNYQGGSITWPDGSLANIVFPAGTVFPFSTCSAQTTTRTVPITVDLAAASNYVLPWPPPPVSQNEMVSLAELRLSVKWQPCTP